jgi:hypothetical protein
LFGSFKSGKTQLLSDKKAGSDRMFSTKQNAPNAFLKIAKYGGADK